VKLVFCRTLPTLYHFILPAPSLTWTEVHRLRTLLARGAADAELAVVVAAPAHDAAAGDHSARVGVASGDGLCRAGVRFILGTLSLCAAGASMRWPRFDASEIEGGTSRCPPRGTTGLGTNGKFLFEKVVC
jgi:hypothetical protein